MTRLAQGAPASVREILLRRRKTTCINHHVSVPRLEFQESSYSSGASQTVARKAGRALSAERVTSYFKNSKLTKTTTVESGGGINWKSYKND